MDLTFLENDYIVDITILNQDDYDAVCKELDEMGLTYNSGESFSNYHKSRLEMGGWSFKRDMRGAYVVTHHRMSVEKLEHNPDIIGAWAFLSYVRRRLERMEFTPTEYHGDTEFPGLQGLSTNTTIIDERERGVLSLQQQYQELTERTIRMVEEGDWLDALAPLEPHELAPTHNPCGEIPIINQGGEQMEFPFKFIGSTKHVRVSDVSQERYSEFLEELQDLGIPWRNGKPATTFNNTRGSLSHIVFSPGNYGMDASVESGAFDIYKAERMDKMIDLLKKQQSRNPSVTAFIGNLDRVVYVDLRRQSANTEEFDTFFHLLDDLGFEYLSGERLLDISFSRGDKCFLVFHPEKPGGCFLATIDDYHSQNHYKTTMEIRSFTNFVEKRVNYPEASNNHDPHRVDRARVREFVYENLLSRYKPAMVVATGKVVMINTSVPIQSITFNFQQEGEVLVIGLGIEDDIQVNTFSFIDAEGKDTEEKVYNIKDLLLDRSEYNYVTDVTRDEYNANIIIPMRRGFVSSYIQYRGVFMNRIITQDTNLENHSNSLADGLESIIKSKTNRWFNETEIDKSTIKQIILSNS